MGIIKWLDKKGNVTERTDGILPEQKVYPFRYERSLRPYHDAFRWYNVPKYNSTDPNKDGKQVSVEDAERFGISPNGLLVGPDDWLDPSENGLNWLVAGGLGGLRAASALKPGTIGGDFIGLTAGWTAASTAANKTYKKLTGSENGYMDDVLNSAGITNPIGRFVGYLADPLNWVNYGKLSNLVLNSFKKLPKRVPDYENYTPELWDADYNRALEAGDMDQLQKLRDLHYLSSVPYSKFTVSSSGTPITYYHGTPWGGHAKFNSNQSNVTIGGQSSYGKVKGNFLTTSKDAAALYAGGSSTIVNPRFMHTYDNKYVTDLMDTKNKFKTDLRLQYEQYEQDLIGINPKKRRSLLTDFLNLNRITLNDIHNTSQILNNVIYPLYVNPGNKTKVVDFEGLPWSEGPQIPSSYKVMERLPKWIPNENGINSMSDEIRTVATFNNKDDAMSFMNNRKGRRTSQTTMTDGKLNTTTDAYGYPERRLRNRSIIGVFENKYPHTTNGVIQRAYDDGYNSVVIDNVLDGVEYPIQDFITFNTNQMKLANPITYDNKGNIIPLSKRDNWLMPDVRYSLLPLIIGGSTIGIKRNSNKED